MAEKLLHEGCTLKCSICQAEAKPVQLTNDRYRVQGKRVLMPTDLFTCVKDASKCKGPQTPSSQTTKFPPCRICLSPDILVWLDESKLTKIDGVPVLLQTSVGAFVNFMLVPTPMTITDGNPSTIAKST